MNVAPLQQSLTRIVAWRNLPFFKNGQFNEVCRELAQERRRVFPTACNILRAYELVQPSDVRVVILGQDPYPQLACATKSVVSPRRAVGSGQDPYPQPPRATGLAFAVRVGCMPQQGSLLNIFDKVRKDPGIPSAPLHCLAAHSDLTGWARQGVLLLNTALTVPENTPGGHGGIGWSPLISQTLRCLAPRSDIAWLLCGYRAKQRVSRLSLRGLVICTGHPSRKHLFAAARSNGRAVPHPFSCINGYLNNRSIDWHRP